MWNFLPCPNRTVGRKRSFVADQRGAVALETPTVYLFLIISILLPLADLGIAGFQYVSAFEALRAFGQYLQYNQPPDVTNSSSWQSAVLAKASSSYQIANFQLICGDSSSVCSSANTVSPKYYSYTTSITLSPMVLKSVLCTSGNSNSCTFTLSYSERFQ